MPTSNSLILALQRRWWIVLVVLAGAVAASVGLTGRERPMFRASTTHVVIPNTTVESPAEIMRTIETLERRSIIATFAKIPMSPAMRDQAAKEMAIETAALSSYRVSSGVVPNTNLIKVDIEGPDARVAAAKDAEAMPA